jgi:hypothetical protein
MKTKICTMKKCQETKPLSEFNKDSSTPDGYSYKCRECAKELQRIHYHKNKKQYKQNLKNRRKNTRQFLETYKSERGCSRCFENHPACLEFHHRDPDLKEIEISDVICSGWAYKRIMKEIEKCDIFCSNCHRKLHYKVI